MIDLPALSWDVTFFEVVAAVAMFAFGYLTHELMHIGALEALREPYEVEVGPDGLRAALLGGTGVNVQMQSMPARWRVAVVMFAPAIMAVPPLMGYAIALSYPVLDVGTAMVLGLWFIAAIPGLHDWVTVLSYRPNESVAAEVTT